MRNLVMVLAVLLAAVGLFLAGMSAVEKTQCADRGGYISQGRCVLP